jgi:hypothetical protein
MKQYDQGFWTVDSPDGWIVQEDDFPITFLDEQGDWAIQISHYLKEPAAVTHSNLEEFIADIEKVGCVKKGITTPNAKGLQVEFTDRENILWRHTLLRSGHIMLYITYNVNKDGRQLSDESFRGFLESIQIKGKPAAPPDRL